MALNWVQEPGPTALIDGAFVNRTLSDLSGFFSECNALLSDKNPLRSLRVRLPKRTQSHKINWMRKSSRQVILYISVV
jgi:hypothetical protein